MSAQTAAAVGQFDMFAMLHPAPDVAPMCATRWEVVAVAERGDTTRAKVEASYSAASLGDSGKVLRPFRFRGAEWVTTGCSHLRGDADYDCYRIVPASEFSGPGEAATYHDHDFHGDRRARLGGYHGMAAKHGRVDVVLVGPPIVLVAKAATA